MTHTFEEYKRIFSGAISKYESQSFFSTLIQEHGRPTFPLARLQVAIVGIRHEGKETSFRDKPPTTQSVSSCWIETACRRCTNTLARPTPVYSTR